MADINLKGMGVALITPFKEDESVDYEALGKLVDYQVQNGTDYLVCLLYTSDGAERYGLFGSAGYYSGNPYTYGRRKEKHYKLGSDSCTGPYPYRIRRGR